MKLLGAVLVVGAFSIGGFSMNRKLYARCVMWGKFIEGMGILESEIGFAGTELKEALKRAGNICGAQVFKTASDILEEYGINKAWERAVKETVSKEEDRSIMLQLSSKIGKTDAAGQVKHIEYMISIAERAKAAADTEYKDKGKLLCRGGVLLGLLAAAVLM